MEMEKKIEKSLRTQIADLEVEMTEEQLARVAGGLNIRFGGGGLGGGLTVAENKCWQASASVTNPGDTDTAQDYVVD
jgi:hypothetical protein